MVEREFAGNAPPIILDDGILLSGKFVLSTPVTVTFLSKVAFSATNNALIVDVPVTFNLFPTERSSLICAPLTAVILSLTNNRFVIVTSLSNVSAGNPLVVATPPPIIAFAGILFAANPAVKYP